MHERVERAEKIDSESIKNMCSDCYLIMNEADNNYNYLDDYFKTHSKFENKLSSNKTIPNPLYFKYEKDEINLDKTSN